MYRKIQISISFIIFAGLLIIYILNNKLIQPNPINTTNVSSSIYPNKSLTPGDVFTNATTSQICKTGYTATVRNVSVSTKKQVYQEYGISYPKTSGSYEVDHFIPLELGGSNSIKNLWPEPASPTPGFHQKDIVENYLHYEVCSNQMSLTDAQNEIKTDWYSIYKQIPDPSKYQY